MKTVGNSVEGEGGKRRFGTTVSQGRCSLRASREGPPLNRVPDHKHPSSSPGLPFDLTSGGCALGIFIHFFHVSLSVYSVMDSALRVVTWRGGKAKVPDTLLCW